MFLLAFYSRVYSSTTIKILFASRFYHIKHIQMLTSLIDVERIHQNRPLKTASQVRFGAYMPQ
jgi:hypothetical protein